MDYIDVIPDDGVEGISPMYSYEGDKLIGFVPPDYNPGTDGTAPGSGLTFDWLSSLFGSLNPDNITGDQSELFKSYFDFIRENTDYNNAWSAEQAEKQMNFQDLQRQLAQEYNTREAAKNRDWQKMMSDTAHQREVADLKAAGLNPILSAMGGNGASVTSGATASTSAGSGAKGDSDQSANMAITSLLSGFLNATMNLQAKQIDAMTSLGVAEKYTQMEQIIESMKESYGKWEHENYPGNLYEAISAIVGLLGERDPAGSAKDLFQTYAEETRRTYDEVTKRMEDWFADYKGDSKETRESKRKTAYGTGYGPAYFGHGSTWEGSDTFKGRFGTF